MSFATRSSNTARPSKLATAWSQIHSSGQYKTSLSKSNISDFSVDLITVADCRYKKVLSYFEDAYANNYKFAVGGNIDPNPTNGLYVPISIVDNPPDDSKIVREEPFGPIVPLLKWSDEKDVVKRASK